MALKDRRTLPLLREARSGGRYSQPGAQGRTRDLVRLLRHCHGGCLSSDRLRQWPGVPPRRKRDETNLIEGAKEELVGAHVDNVRAVMVGDLKLAVLQLSVLPIRDRQGIVYAAAAIPNSLNKACMPTRRCS